MSLTTAPVFTLKELVTFEELAANYPLLQLLNPHLSQADYEEMLVHMLQHDYKQVAVLNERKEIIGLSGYWIGTKIYSGKYLEMDNVIVLPSYRSQGIGKILCHWMEEKAKAESCKCIMLDAYVVNKDAHRFYFREGFVILGFHMLKNL
ncbi:acetyltransferase (GNAT) family protein [Chitinophaga skermanii]|uniref:Acetyltransferase (GNAT) family protein n=1 Tax=Chitinophaga skermanii TaxID=331697 RepID=A0A327QY57_9BACT|nr:GNAT family N-acetyltransferase [Chitinophaga skermanii]RAJ08905.1 acetyltransferase (GNAT) family protein [Chitinophaga skermanii]